MVGVPRGSRPATLLVRAKLATSHGARVCKAGGGRGALFSAASCVECARADKIILSASTRLSTSAATTLSSTMLSTSGTTHYIWKRLFRGRSLSLLVLSWLFGGLDAQISRRLSTSNRSLLNWPETHGSTVSI